MVKLLDNTPFLRQAISRVKKVICNASLNTTIWYGNTVKSMMPLPIKLACQITGQYLPILIIGGSYDEDYHFLWKYDLKSILIVPVFAHHLGNPLRFKMVLHNLHYSIGGRVNKILSNGKWINIITFLFIWIILYIRVDKLRYWQRKGKAISK